MKTTVAEAPVIRAGEGIAFRRELGSATKNRGQFLKLLQTNMRLHNIHPAGKVFVVGASPAEVDLLRRAGFRHLTVSNIESPAVATWGDKDQPQLHMLVAEAEAIGVADNSYDLVIAHEVLHHCRSPHRALCEMLRISRRHVVLLEPNDSLAMRLLSALKFSFPYELPAVIAGGCESGGVRNSGVPNFIYRWSAEEIFKTASAWSPEYTLQVYAFPYWDFNACPTNLSLRRQTRVPALARLAGPERLLKGLRIAQRALNLIPPVRKQGNKLFCCVEKGSELKPWLKRINDRIAFDRSYQASQGIRAECCRAVRAPVNSEPWG